MKDYTITSESVTEGHPDKVCDQISDAILDNLIAQDPESRVAVECMVTTGSVHVAGEVTTKGFVDAQRIARQTLKEIGYTDPRLGWTVRMLVFGLLFMGKVKILVRELLREWEMIRNKVQEIKE